MSMTSAIDSTSAAGEANSADPAPAHNTATGSTKCLTLRLAHLSVATGALPAQATLDKSILGMATLVARSRAGTVQPSVRNTQPQHGSPPAQRLRRAVDGPHRPPGGFAQDCLSAPDPADHAYPPGEADRSTYPYELPLTRFADFARVHSEGVRLCRPEVRGK